LTSSSPTRRIRHGGLFIGRRCNSDLRQRYDFAWCGDLDLTTLATQGGATITLPNDDRPRFASTPAIGDFNGDGVGDVAVLLND
jgi:hypothetical protein